VSELAGAANSTDVRAITIVAARIDHERFRPLLV